MSLASAVVNGVLILDRGAHRTVLVLLLMLVGGPLLAQDQTPKELPADVVKAWQQAGAKVGWMKQDARGILRFRKGGKGEKGATPAFDLHPWKEGVLPKLPAPAVGFGLDVSNLTVTSRVLKELASLKQLQML